MLPVVEKYALVEHAMPFFFLKPLKKFLNCEWMHGVHETCDENNKKSLLKRNWLEEKVLK